ncbi:Chaperone protein HtpG OS=Streptomyces antimycoticus OX=68175 GN=htpG PE=3 SV=1 [Streptomyces antimycoticus]
MLLLTDPIDELWVDACAGGSSCVPSPRGRVDLDSQDEKDEEAEASGSSAEGLRRAALLDDDGAGEQVKEVRLSTPAHGTSPACIVG